MNRQWLLPAKILTGVCTLAVSAFSQTYTVSAKPGALNFIQGEVAINGDPVWTANLKSTFLNANDSLVVDNGKAEVLLTPGVFLRVGEHSQVRMLKPSLIETQIEVVSGESMLEVDDVVPGSSVVVLDHGFTTTLTKPGLFRFTEHAIAALDGKADVAFGARRMVLNKDKEVQFDDSLRASKVDLKQADDLYAWSNTRALTNAAASYAGSTSAYNAGGYGYSSYSSPGWYWASGFNSYMWMPGNGVFYSPFGWGFYGPGLVSYAPVMYAPYGYGNGYYYPVQTSASGVPVKKPVTPTTVAVAHFAVPLNPSHVGSTVNVSSPAGLNEARIMNQNYVNFYGLRTADGSSPAMMRGGQTFPTMQAASRAAVSSARGSSASGSGYSNSSSGYSASSSSGSSVSARSSSSGGFSGGSSSAMSHGSGGASGGHGK